MRPWTGFSKVRTIKDMPRRSEIMAVIRCCAACGLLALGGMACRGAGGGAEPWLALEPGLEIARFDSRSAAPADGGDLTVLRVDPKRWHLRVMTTETAGDAQPRSLDRWCREFDLVAAINAGMYQQDGKTHVGYCRVSGRVVNPTVNRYRSAAAMDPVRDGLPPFRIFDLDETPLDSITAAYGTVVQNLRLIKRPAQPRWPTGSQSWSEAALGEDGRGRALLMHCTRPLPMHDFNELILALPLDVVCAQHLEGNFPAQLWVRHPQWSDPGPGAAGQPRVLPVIIGIAAPDSVSAPAPPGP